MNMIQSFILLSLFLCATGSANAMQGEEEPIITLCSIKNSITSPDNAGHIECLVDGKEVGIVHSCHSSILNKVLFTRKDKIDPVIKKFDKYPISAIKRINFELRHPKQDGFKELRLKLTFDRPQFAIVQYVDNESYDAFKAPMIFDGPHLAIVKDLADGIQRQEFHLLDDGKKYLLHVRIHNDDQVSAELEEDNQ